MDSIYVLIPVTTILLGLAIAAYLWSVNSGRPSDCARCWPTKDETPATPPPAADAGRQ